LDNTGLYYYGARYYDASIGRFISADTVVQNFGNPQTLNRYSYVANNPLKYTDPSGQMAVIGEDDLGNVIQINSKGDVSPNAYLPQLPMVKTITITSVDNPFKVSFNLVEDPFSVHEPGIINNPGWPLGYGAATIRGNATYTNSGVTISVSIVSTEIDMPATIVNGYQAQVQVESQTYTMKLDPPKSAILPANSQALSGTMNISCVSLDMQVSLMIKPSAYDLDSSKIKALPNKVVVPYAWNVNLGTGEITRYNWYIR
jgi:RHS repeat-associated protein